MRKIIVGNRTKAPGYFDLIARWPAPGIKRAGFYRVGDRAAAYILCLEWRLANPDRKLIVIDMPLAHNEMLTIFPAVECSAEWMFSELADEIWLFDDHTEEIAKPDAEPLVDLQIWEWWYYFSQRKGYQFVHPTIRPPENALKRVEKLRKEWNLPFRYATIQPLFDAPYAVYRNRPPEYWEEVIAYNAPKIPLVVLGHPANYSKLSIHPQVYSGWARGLSVIESIAMVSGSTMHVGGETGTTIWASVMGVNTYGIYENVEYAPEDRIWLAEPLPFAGKVRVNKGMELSFTKADIFDWWEKLNDHQKIK